MVATKEKQPNHDESENRKKTKLQQCLEAGSVINLFPLLSTWSMEDLKDLLSEINEASGDEVPYDEFIAYSEICSVALYYLGDCPDIPGINLQE